MQKNYYVILGVASNASTEEIKSAFRRRAQELHPDHSGMESGPFLELQEAYGVLSNPERRRRYDGQARPPAVRRAPWGPAPEPLIPPERPRGEPLHAGDWVRSERGISLVDSFGSYRPSFDELFDRLWSNFEAVSRPKAERLESLTMELELTADESRHGGSVEVLIPARATCPSCGGHGGIGPYQCWRCEGQGALTSEYPIEVVYPGGIRDGHAVRISLAQFGIGNFYLTVVFRVRAGWP